MSILNLTTAKKTRIIDIAKIVKSILKKKEISVKILPSRKKDNLQKSVNNLSNNFFLKFWKPKYNIRSGIEEIIEYHLNIYGCRYIYMTNFEQIVISK